MVYFRVQFYFILFFLFDPSWSELIRPGLAVRVDPVRLLYLPYNLNGIGAWSPTTLFTRQNQVESSHFEVANTFQAIVLGFAWYFNVT